MTDYLIRLNPVDMFFFGGEQTFGYLNNTDYFGISNLFPQQTAILGMLRKEILIQANIYKEIPEAYTDDNHTQMNKNIGHKSFNVDEALDGKTQEFGFIKNISPLFISKAGINFIKKPFDLSEDHCKSDLNFFKKKGKAYINNRKDFIPLLDGYNPKKGIADQFISHDKKTIKDSKDIFIPHIKIGINKMDRGVDNDEENFFKQQFYRLKQGYEFAFFASIDKNIKNNSLVSIGAENSPFIMKVETAKTSFQQLFQHEKTDRLTLLSDALVSSQIYENCDFAITKTLNFRNIRTKSGDYRYKDKGENKSKSRKYTFLSCGSVFFIKKEKREAAEKCIRNEHLEKIGYNIFA